MKEKRKTKQKKQRQKRAREKYYSETVRAKWFSQINM